MVKTSGKILQKNPFIRILREIAHDVHGPINKYRKKVYYIF